MGFVFPGISRSAAGAAMASPVKYFPIQSRINKDAKLICNNNIFQKLLLFFRSIDLSPLPGLSDAMFFCHTPCASLRSW